MFNGIDFGNEVFYNKVYGRCFKSKGIHCAIKKPNFHSDVLYLGVKYHIIASYKFLIKEADETK